MTWVRHTAVSSKKFWNPWTRRSRRGGGGEQVREGGGEVQAGGPSDGAHAEDPQVPQAAAEAGGPDLCLTRGVPQHRAGILHNQR